MARLMRNDAFQLIGIISRQNQAGMDKDVLPARDKGVQAIVVDDVDIDGRGRQSASP